MKKLSLLLLFLVAAFALPILAQAETYTCSDHPNASTRTYRVQYSVDRYSVVKHRIHGGTQVRCSVCNKLLHEDNRFEEHSYGGNTCSVCGQQRSSKDTLETEAQYLIYTNNIYNHACWVLYKGKLYSEPSTSSVYLGTKSFGESFYVNDYTTNGGKLWIELKKLPSDSPSGWFEADQLYIEPAAPNQVTGYEVGRTIRITASSGRGRVDAGTEYLYIETVRYGERYTVLDAKMGTNGNMWYKIHVKGRDCWISSGLATIE